MPAYRFREKVPTLAIQLWIANPSVVMGEWKGKSNAISVFKIPPRVLVRSNAKRLGAEMVLSKRVKNVIEKDRTLTPAPVQLNVKFQMRRWVRITRWPVLTSRRMRSRPSKLQHRCLHDTV